MRDLALKILKMSLYISVAATSEGLDVMDDSQGQGCKRTHIKLISLGEVEFDGACKIRYPLKALLYLTQPPQQHPNDWHKSRGTHQTHNLSLCFNTLPTCHFSVALFHTVLFIIHAHVLWTFTSSSVTPWGPLILLHPQTNQLSGGQRYKSMWPRWTCC